MGTKETTVRTPRRRQPSLLLGTLAALAVSAAPPAKGQDAPVPFGFADSDLPMTLPSGNEIQREIVLRTGPTTTVTGFRVEPSDAPIELWDPKQANQPLRKVLPYKLSANSLWRLRLKLDTSPLALGETVVRVFPLAGDQIGSPLQLRVLVTPATDLGAIEAEDRAEGLPEQLPVEGPPPKIVFDRYVHAFGTRLSGERLSTTFEFENEGEGEMIIQRVSRQCHCSVGKLVLPSGEVRWEKQERGKPLGVLAPGEAATLEVVVDTSDIGTGAIAKEFGVFTNDPVNHPATVTVKVQVTNPFQVVPPVALLGAAARSEFQEKVLHVSSSVLGDFNIVGHEMPTPAVLDFTHERDPKGGHWIRLNLRDDAVFGIHKGYVIVHVDHERVQRFRIEYSLELLPDILFMAQGTGSNNPHQLQFGVARKLGELGRFAIDNHNPAVPYVPSAVRVEAKTGAELYEAEIIPVEEGSKYEVVLKLKEKPRLRFLKGQLVVISDHPMLPEQVLDFSGLYQGPR